MTFLVPHSLVPTISHTASRHPLYYASLWVQSLVSHPAFSLSIPVRPHLCCTPDQQPIIPWWARLSWDHCSTGDTTGRPPSCPGLLLTHKCRSWYHRTTSSSSHGLCTGHSIAVSTALMELFQLAVAVTEPTACAVSSTCQPCAITYCSFGESTWMATAFVTPRLWGGSDVVTMANGDNASLHPCASTAQLSVPSMVFPGAGMSTKPLWRQYQPLVGAHVEGTATSTDWLFLMSWTEILVQLTKYFSNVWVSDE